MNDRQLRGVDGGAWALTVKACGRAKEWERQEDWGDENWGALGHFIFSILWPLALLCGQLGLNGNDLYIFVVFLGLNLNPRDEFGWESLG